MPDAVAEPQRRAEAAKNQPKSAIMAEAGRLIKIIAPRIGGVTCSKNNLHPVHEKIAGAPSVLFDAVPVLPLKHSLAATPAAQSFPRDAHLHCKYVGWSKEASALVPDCGLPGAKDEDSVPLPMRHQFRLLSMPAGN